MSTLTNTIWVLNCGSSSIKFAIYQTPNPSCLCHGLVDNIGTGSTQANIVIGDKKASLDIPHHDYAMAMQVLINHLRQHTNLIDTLSATGHRVVHGGTELTQPSIVDNSILQKLQACAHLAPLHNPANILGITTCQALLPNIPHIAVFDTGFHQSIPEHAATYALPFELSKQHGIRKYGFHGISYDYITLETAKRLGKSRGECNMIVAHLGNGASICAIKKGLSVDTSMGMTPLAGIPMGTRCGDIDPSIIDNLCKATTQSLDQVMQMLTRESGLKGLSGISHDMRELIKARDQGNQQASLALAIFAYRIAMTMASYMVPLQHIDAIVFTGGIGENNPSLRMEVIQYLSFLGLTINEKSNASPTEHHGKISASKSPITAWVIPTQEEQHIASLTHQILKEPASCDPS